MSPLPFDTPSAPQRERIWDVVLVIAAGGAIGGAARHILNTVFAAQDRDFPWSTFVENATGSLAMGFLMVLLIEVWPPSRYRRPFLGVGVLGGFTTFSAYTTETRALLMAGEGATALLYLFGSVAVGIAAVAAGISAARALTERRSRRRT